MKANENKCVDLQKDVNETIEQADTGFIAVTIPYNVYTCFPLDDWNYAEFNNPEIACYNRWGDCLYKSSDTLEKLFCHGSNKPLIVSGTYFYVVRDSTKEYSDSSCCMYGTFTVIN